MSVQLDEFLNSRSVANLQLLQWLWAANTARSSSKSELLRLLRQAMLNPGRVREAFNTLGFLARDFLKALLRQEGYEGDAAVLFHRIAQPRSAPSAQRDLLDELSRRGFVICSAATNDARTAYTRVTVPQEVGDVLAEALNLDIREPAVMLSLWGRLGQRRGGVPAELLDPQAIEQRIAALPSPAMQRAVRLALTDHAGILPLERFPSLGLDIESVDGPQWRSALEAGLLGTFGHLSLLEHGLGDDHVCLVVYQELVEAHAAAGGRDTPPLDHVYACGIDFLTDVTTLVDFIRSSPSKLTSAGRFFKGARNQALPLMALRTTFFMDEEALLGHKLAVAQGLGLIEPGSDERVHATRAAAGWEGMPLPKQAQSLLDALLQSGAGACQPEHFAALAAVAREVLLACPQGLWFPTNAFLARIFARYLLRLLEEEETGEAPAAPGEDALWGQTRALPTIGTLAAAAREPLLSALNCAGVLDIGRQGDHSFVAASPLASVILGQKPLEAATGPLLLVNPDFEVILFPEPGHLGLLHRLCAFAERDKSEVTLHLRLTQESIQRAVLRGLGPEEIIATLQAHCRAQLSQNIEYSIRNWAASVHPAEVRTMHVLELASPEALDAALRLPEIAPVVLRRLSPTAVALSVPQLGPEAENALRELGIHLM